MTDYPSIDRLAELQQMIADFAKVKRTNKLIDNPGTENDVEHSYGLALTCWFLQPYIASELDLQKVILYSLVHDLVELHAGDQYFLLNEEAAKQKKESEAKAAKIIEKNWAADFPSLVEYIHNYEKKAEEECWFVYAVDKILPPIMINLHEKEAYYKKWKLDKKSLFDKKRETMAKSKHMGVYIERYIDWLEKADYYYQANGK